MPDGSLRYGIGEWYGRLFYLLTVSEKREINRRRLAGGAETPRCPFKPKADDGQLQPCDKKGGVCSLKLYRQQEAERAAPIAEPKGRLVVTCPARFHQGGRVESWVGEELLGNSNPELLPQIGFLTPDRRSPMVGEESLAANRSAKVGRIDAVLVSPEDGPLNWCPVEHQAVYFSGDKMDPEFDAAASADFDGAHFPVGRRRPDFRSSGPKRLMPQLQIKVPTLSRWGKRMGVVVDEAFYDALGEMEEVQHASNADIAWFVVGLDETPQGATLTPRGLHLTTLQRAVEGLTAGKPVTREEFEEMIARKRIAVKMRQEGVPSRQPRAKTSLD